MKNNWKIAFFTLLALILIGGNVFVWFFWGKNLLSEKQETPTPKPEVTVKLIPTPTEKIISPAEEEALIRKAVYEKSGTKESEYLITINKNTGQHATGGIKPRQEDVGGAYWLAAKTDEGWIGIYDGQSQPECEIINLYNFPKDMVTECVDKNGKVVKR